MHFLTVAATLKIKECARSVRKPSQRDLTSLELRCTIKVSKSFEVCGVLPCSSNADSCVLGKVAVG
jgi:hypothetical protein